MQLLAANMTAYDGYRIEEAARELRSMAGAACGHVGAVAGSCFGAEAHLVPVFHAMLGAQHWAARHLAMMALLHYSRSAQVRRRLRRCSGCACSSRPCCGSQGHDR